MEFKYQFIAKFGQYFNISDIESLFSNINLLALIKESNSLDCFREDIKLDNLIYDFVTVIIPYRYDNNSINLDLILENLKLMGVKHIIISEEDNYSKISQVIDKWSSDFDINLVFTKSKNLFNKSIAVNEALKSCTTEYLCIINDSFLISKQYFDIALSYINSFFDFVYFSNNIKDYFLLDKIDEFNFSKLNSKKDIDVVSSNVLFCKKRSLIRIGGYNPLFYHEDYSNYELLLRVILSEFTIHHLGVGSYYLNFESSFSLVEFELLIKQYNLAMFGDVDVLINQNEDMYMNSLMVREDSNLEISSGDFLISIIIPVYNCEFFYIDRCMNSLINQTLGFENIEVILVDDASEYQSSIDLIKFYDEKYDNVKAIFLDINSGAGVARNVGLKFATSDYVAFLDYDDYYLKNICEIFYENMVNENIDILISKSVNFKCNNTNEIYSNLKFFDDFNNVQRHVDKKILFSIITNLSTIIYNKQFLLKNHLFFTNFKFGLDLYFNERTLSKTNNIKILNVPSVVING